LFDMFGFNTDIVTFNRSRLSINIGAFIPTNGLTNAFAQIAYKGSSDDMI
jgi:hypothetical protein